VHSTCRRALRHGGVARTTPRAARGGAAPRRRAVEAGGTRGAPV